MNKSNRRQVNMPAANKVAKELAKAKSINDFWGKEGIFAKLFSKTMENMLQAEMDEHLGYQKHDAEGWNSGNSRNGYYKRTLKTSGGQTEMDIPRDRKGKFKSSILDEYSSASNEIEKKVIAMYSKGTTVEDIRDNLMDMYGLDVSTALISQMTDKIWPIVEEWQNRPLQEVYPIIYLDCMHTKLRTEGKVKNVAVYSILAIDIEGKKDILGQWIGKGGESSSYWLKVITELKNRGVKDVLIACVDGLIGFKEAIQSVFPESIIQRCIIHQIRSSLKYVSWKDKKEFVQDLKTVYKADTLEQAESNLEKLAKRWENNYGLAVRGWNDNWEDLSVYFKFSPEIRKIIYTTNIIEGYHRMVRKVTKSKSVFPSDKSIRKMYYLATQNAKRKMNVVRDWPQILNQLDIEFKDRLQL